MSLHQTAVFMKKAVLGMVIGLVATIILVFVARIGIFIKNTLYPPEIIPPNYRYGMLPAIQFPRGVFNQNFTYTLNTLTGTLPVFPDRVNIYPIIQPQPNLLNLSKVQSMVSTLGFANPDGTALPETSLGNSLYQWKMQDPTTGMSEQITFNTVSLNFNFISEYLPSLTVLQAQNLQDQNAAIETVQNYLDSISLLPDDIDLTKTQTPNPTVDYVTYPQLFSIQNGTLVPATSLSSAQVIRVDLYQKDLQYDLNTGIQGDNHTLKTVKMDLPILYPNPPYSTMSFWIASGGNGQQVVQANFVHQEIDTSADALGSTVPDATYAIKTAQQALSQLQAGKAYIASYNGTSSTVLINNVYLAYYLGQTQQAYLMPIIVFEGNDNFFAYVSAVQDQWVE